MAGAVVLPTSPVGARTSWTQREGTCSSTSPRAHHIYLRVSSLPRSSFFAWDARTHLGSPSLRSFLSSTDCFLASKLLPRRVVHASLLGVGAPEALVIAVVALLVFGPRGLAEVARTLGKSLRAFQPTIRELQQVSNDFKDALQQEMGLDELRMDARPPPNYKADQQSQASADTPSESVKPKGYSSEDYVRVTEEQARALVPEEQRKAAEAAAWSGSSPSAKTQTEEPIQRSDEVTNNAGCSQ